MAIKNYTSNVDAYTSLLALSGLWITAQVADAVWTDNERRMIMLRITLEVEAPAEAAQGVKEQIAMELEKYGDVRVVKVEETGQRKWRQMQLDG